LPATLPPNIQPPTRQARSKLACDNCRSRKLKCDNHVPCHSCQKRSVTCMVTTTRTRWGGRSSTTQNFSESTTSQPETTCYAQGNDTYPGSYDCPSTRSSVHAHTGFSSGSGLPVSHQLDRPLLQPDAVTESFDSCARALSNQTSTPVGHQGLSFADPSALEDFVTDTDLLEIFSTHLPDLVSIIHLQFLMSKLHRAMKIGCSALMMQLQIHQP
jgi:hypothetical protein